ncbi:MAG: hypothetical protein SH850_09985 [Planctomycetaceae bacterium]|nr:hypothetical protein [Planctomycetaceae bacterium]
MFHTPTKPYGGTATWRKITTVVSEEPGQPVFFEIWDDGWRQDTLVGGFVLYPGPSDPALKPETETFTVPIHWEWKDRSTNTQSGVAKVKVRFAHVGGAP